MKRMYQQCAASHFRKNRQMLFLSGPRQVGKTSISLLLEEDFPDFHYFDWDNPDHQRILLGGPAAIAAATGIERAGGPPLIVFDEIHKYRTWKNLLKGFYDTYPFRAHILVTGSARLDVYRKGADSLMGRYFRYRIHPLSVRELLEPDVIPEGLRQRPAHLPEEAFDALWQFGGFPDPFLKGEAQFHAQWTTLRRELLFRFDLRDLSRVQELAQIELLAQLLTGAVGGQTSHLSLSKKVGVAHTTVKEWLKLLESLFYTFPVRPYSKNITRSLLKEPKYYLYDWSQVVDRPARAENFVACHLLKAVQFWSDHGMGDFALYYVRDRNKRKVDFLVTKDQKPWMLVEVKLTDHAAISSSLKYFQQQLDPVYALQVVIDLPYSPHSCFTSAMPRIVPARSFLSQLV
ncbi:MAG: ATP-binding protein [Parachlamydiales bacterium]